MTDLAQPHFDAPLRAPGPGATEVRQLIIGRDALKAWRDGIRP